MTIYRCSDCQETEHDNIQDVLTVAVPGSSVSYNRDENLVDTPAAHTWQKQEFVCVCVQSVASCSN